MMPVVTRSRLIQAVEQVLHTPGNDTGGILEMAMVFDLSLSAPVRREISMEIMKVLKSHSEVFRNVRVNIVTWSADTKPECRVVPMTLIMLGNTYGPEERTELETPENGGQGGTGENCADNAGENAAKPRLDILMPYLKLFQARAKLILLLTDGRADTGDMEIIQNAMKPFLEKKLILITTETYSGNVPFRRIIEYPLCGMEGQE